MVEGWAVRVCSKKDGRIMDYEYIARLEKRLDEFYQAKHHALLNTKDVGDIRELLGMMKAIRTFGTMIADNNNVEGDPNEQK